MEAARTVDGIRPAHFRPVTTQEEISAEIAAISREYAASGTSESDVRLDYPPYRSSMLSHPTKSPLQESDEQQDT